MNFLNYFIKLNLLGWSKIQIFFILYFVYRDDYYYVVEGVYDQYQSFLLKKVCCYFFVYVSRVNLQFSYVDIQVKVQRDKYK